MIVFSAFDGASCGQEALRRLGVTPSVYISSEVDKYAMSVTRYNFPNTIFVGDITKVRIEEDPSGGLIIHYIDLEGNPKTLHVEKIDLFMGGSPCQGFSVAGHGLNFDDPRSALFFDFVRLLKESQAEYFLLENVKMKKEYIGIISEQMGVAPIEVNSALVSAQNRRRLYWTNIPFFGQPEDRGLLLRDVLLHGVAIPQMTTVEGKAFAVTSTYGGAIPRDSIQRRRRTMVAESDDVFDEVEKVTGHRPAKGTERNKKYVRRGDQKSITLTAAMYKGAGSNGMTLVEVPIGVCEVREGGSSRLCHHVGDALDINGNESVKRVYGANGKSPSLTTMGGGHRQPKVLICDHLMPKEASEYFKKYELSEQHHKAFLKSYKWEHCPVDGKSKPLLASYYKQPPHSPYVKCVYSVSGYRKLVPIECERLQTLPDNYTAFGVDQKDEVVVVSNTQRYKMLGNGWTVEAIMHIMRGMFDSTPPEDCNQYQISLL